MLLLLSLGVLSRDACTTNFYPLPKVIYGPHVYMLEASSANDICRWMGYAKAGSFRETTLHVLGVSASAIKMSPFQVIKERSTRILVAVECLKAGQKACTADTEGNIGTGNKGKNNFGNYNEGNNNIGSYNKGNLNWGLNNKGTNLRCNDAVGKRTTILNFCNSLPSLTLASPHLPSLLPFPLSFFVPPISSPLFPFPLFSSSPLLFSPLSSSSPYPSATLPHYPFPSPISFNPLLSALSTHATTPFPSTLSPSTLSTLPSATFFSTPVPSTISTLSSTISASALSASTISTLSSTLSASTLSASALSTSPFPSALSTSVLSASALSTSPSPFTSTSTALDFGTVVSASAQPVEM
ncbi:hypothetical protein ACKKBG_A36830 [Auxenochlorella protothecoides x Auxenochlorella symbiontica]